LEPGTGGFEKGEGVSEKIMILGASGFIGSAFVRECEVRGLDFYAAHLNRDHYDDKGCLEEMLDEEGPTLVINAAAFIPSPSVDACKDHPFETMATNVTLPAMLAQVCWKHGVPLAHLSTGCLFNEDREYSETDEPTRGWSGYCGFYVGTKIAAEQIVSKIPQHYILRLRLPFDEFDSPRNYLTKLAGFESVFDHVNSLTHRGDFVKAALDLWALRAPFGIYNVVCEGQVSARQLVLGMMTRGLIKHCPEFGHSETTGARLSVEKLKSAGVKVRTVEAALVEALDNWKK
jgi:3,5-epimerase/4-reductase